MFLCGITRILTTDKNANFPQTTTFWTNPQKYFFDNKKSVVLIVAFDLSYQVTS